MKILIATIIALFALNAAGHDIATLQSRPPNQNTLLDIALKTHNASLQCRYSYIEEGPVAFNGKLCATFIELAITLRERIKQTTSQIKNGADPFTTDLAELTEQELRQTVHLQNIIKGDILAFQQITKLHEKEAQDARTQPAQPANPTIKQPQIPYRP